MRALAQKAVNKDGVLNYGKCCRLSRRFALRAFSRDLPLEP
jgi:hypothetical protein